eukprot:ctg_2359.g440
MPPGLPHSVPPENGRGFLTRSNDMWERYRGTPEEQQLWDLLTESERNECPVGDDAALVHYPHVIPGPLPAEAVPVPQGALGHQVGGDYGERAVPHFVGHCELPGCVEVGRHEVATVSGVLAGGAGADVRS